MKKQPLKIGVVTSSISLSNYFREYANKSKEDIWISSKGLDEAIPIGNKMEKDGVEVIISRKGTAYLLQDALKIPVLSVPMSSFDVLSCITRAKSYGNNILLPCFQFKSAGIKLIEQLLNVKIHQGIYYNKDSLEQVVLEARSQDCEVTIGAGIAKRFAKKYGLNFVEIQTSKDVINETYESAKSVAQSNRKEKERAERYRNIINSSSEGIIVIDRKGVISNINESAIKMIKIKKREVIGESIKRYLPNTPINSVMETQKPLLDKLERFHKELFIFNYQPIVLENEVIGIIATFKDSSNVMRSEHEVRRTLSKGLVAKYTLNDLIHESDKMRDVVAITKKFAATDSTILITGETGTGKEILSQSIHNLSRRRKKPFVSINCAALPDQLLESELFGYEDGAFTGSRKGGKPGLFEIAHRGTILLDEISETSHEVQPRLLRVLQEREVMRIGGVNLIPVDLRVIATSNKNLAKEIKNGRFREDLYYRLNILQINIPPLRDRVEDIPILVKEFIHKLSREHGLQAINVSMPSIKKLMEYSWPGNVRQLLNFIERLILLCSTGFKEKIFEQLFTEFVFYPNESETIKISENKTLKERLNNHRKRNESDIILMALEENQFNKGKTAEMLGISRTTLWKKIKELNI